MRNAFVLCCSVALLATVGTASAQDWTKSKWGPDDEIGAANNMSPDIVVKAAGLIKTGKTYGLGIRDRLQNPGLPATHVQGDLSCSPIRLVAAASARARPLTMTTSSKAGSGSAARSTAWAISASRTYYNGNKSAISPRRRPEETWCRKNPTDGHPRRAARHGRLFQYRHRQGRHRLQRQGDRGSRQEAGRRNPPGRCRLFHTGWVSLIGKDDKRYNTSEPGLGVEGAKYLISKGVVAIGADTWGLEVLPFESKNVFEVHQILLPMYGTYILENMNTAARRRQGL